MAKQTIEQLMKTTIAAAIQQLLNTEGSGYTINATNDIKFDNEAQTKKTISAIIKTGSGTRSDSEDFEAVSSLITIIFEVDLNYRQTFLAILNDYCTAVAISPSGTVTDDREFEPEEADITYQYNLSFGSAVPAGTPYERDVKATSDDRVDRETVTMDVVVLQGAIAYSENFYIHDRKFYVKISGTYQELKGIVTYSEINTPQFAITPIQNQLEPQINLVGYSEAYTVVFNRKKSDTVHEKIIKINHTTKTLTSYDLEVKFTIASTSQTDSCNVKITSIQVDGKKNYETVTLAMLRV